MAEPKDPETVAVELCARFVDAGFIEDTNDNYGVEILTAMGPRYFKDIFGILAGYLGVSCIPFPIWISFCGLVVMGNGDCPVCGGHLLYDFSNGHELKDGDYFTPNSWVVDEYVYHCANCGETYKSKIEL